MNDDLYDAIRPLMDRISSLEQQIIEMRADLEDNYVHVDMIDHYIKKETTDAS